MNELKLKKVEPIYIKQLQTISKQTFLETFASSNSAENMKKYVHENLSISKLTTELNNPNSEFYFAVLDNKEIGFLKINFALAQTELKDDSTVEIERIYVLKEFHGKKVGQFLFNVALNIAQQKNAKYLWLGVWEQNIHAINFYKKNGFVAFDKHNFKLGDDEQTDIMMRLNLNF